jgi:uncharacterized protein YmfQ (DUF2313 family)
MSTWSKLMTCFALELERVDQQVVDIFAESVPGLSINLLPDWERVLGLPDECSSLAPTIEERQRITHTKYITNYTTLNTQFFIDYAAALGSSITITNNTAGNIFRVDHNRVDRTPELGIDGARLGSIGSYAQILIQIDGSDPNKDYLICYFNRIKPAHIRFIWILI